MTKTNRIDNSNQYSLKNTIKHTLIIIVISFTLLITVFWIIDYSNALDEMISPEQEKEIEERNDLFFSNHIKGIEKDSRYLQFGNSTR